MSDKQIASIRTLAEAFESLPEGKQEYLLGYAEGVIAARKPEESPPPEDRKSD